MSGCGVLWELSCDELEWLPIGAGRTWLTLALVALTMVIMQLTPKYAKRVADAVPPSLIAIVAGTVLEHCVFRPCDLSTRTVGETAEIDGARPCAA